MTGRSPKGITAQGTTLGGSELSNLRSERAAGGSSLAILPIPFALSERKIAIPFIPRALPWAVFPLGFQPVIARNHCCYTIYCALFLFCFQPVIARNHCCSTVLCVIFLLGFYSAIAARWIVSKNRGTLLPWREKYFCFVRVFRCKTSSFDGGIVGRKKDATIFSILYTYFFL